MIKLYETSVANQLLTDLLSAKLTAIIVLLQNTPPHAALFVLLEA